MGRELPFLNLIPYLFCMYSTVPRQDNSDATLLSVKVQARQACLSLRRALHHPLTAEYQALKPTSDGMVGSKLGTSICILPVPLKYVPLSSSDGAPSKAEVKCRSANPSRHHRYTEPNWPNGKTSLELGLPPHFLLLSPFSASQGWRRKESGTLRAHG